MLRHYQPPNLSIMDAIQRKELLHLRIEQATEEMQIVLSKMVEALFQTYQPEVIEATATEPVPEWAKPMTAEESLADLREGVAEYHRGEYLTLEDSSKEAATW